MNLELIDINKGYLKYKKYFKYPFFANFAEKAERIKSEKRKKEYLLSNFLKLKIVNDELKIPYKKIKIELRKSGKPFLKTDKNFHFNISHCSNMLAIVWDNSPVGVDIEKSERKIRKTKSLAERLFSEKEKKLLENSNSDTILNQNFLYLWTRKEAALKALGTGISELKLNSFSVTEKSVKIKNQYFRIKSLKFHSHILSIAIQEQNNFVSDLSVNFKTAFPSGKNALEFDFSEYQC